jgi:hypothetical protein
MSDLFDTATAAERRAATLLIDRLRSTDPITRADLNTAMIEGYGGTDADGLWTQRDSFEIPSMRSPTTSSSVPIR